MRTCLTLVGVIILSLSVSAQCDTISVGTADGPSVGDGQTPFPTNPGRGSKVQYLFLASELSALMCPFSQVNGIAMDVLDNDITTPYPCEVILQVRVGHTSMTSLALFEPFVSALPMNSGFSADTIEVGRLTVPFTVPFIWDGTSNMVVDISCTRNPVTGLSPRVVVDDNLGFTSTRFMHTPWAISGQLLTDSLIGNNGFVDGWNDTRPVIHFISNGAMILAVDDSAAPGASITPNPSPDLVTILNEGAPLTGTIELLDASGRVALRHVVSSTSSRSTVLRVGDLAPGMYSVRSIPVSGAPVLFGRVVVE